MFGVPPLRRFASSAVKSISDCRLYAFLDTAYLNGRSPETLTEALCVGGADIIQLRAKNAPPEEVLALAKRIKPITYRAGVLLVVNDFLEIARAVGAQLCHLGQEDFF